MSRPLNPEELAEQEKATLDRAGIIARKPRTLNVSDDDWVARCLNPIGGIMHALSHCFDVWFEKNVEIGAFIKHYPDADGDWEKYYFMYFGEAGVEACTTAGHNLQHIAAFMRNRKYSIEELGAFGVWLTESGVPVDYAGAVIYEFLTD